MARCTKNISLVLYLAVLRLGAIYVPLNPAYTTFETEHFVENCKPKLFVTCNRHTDIALNDLLDGTLVDEKLILQQSSMVGCLLDVENVQDDDIATILYTSGTTGKPKGAALNHGALRRNAEALVECWRFTANDILLHTLPFYHIHGMFLSFHCSLLSKSCTIFLPRFNVNEVLRWLPKSTVFSGVPSYYGRLLESRNFVKELTSNIRLFVSGSAPLTPILFDKFYARTGHKLLERYGMTETMVITSMPYENEERFADSVGKPLPGAQMRIAEDGVVEVKSDSLFSGYWCEPEKTSKEFTSDGFFRTGDLGSIDKNGFLRLNGRQKDLIISGGLNVYAKEVEEVIDAAQIVAESSVIGVPHSDFGEGVIAVCVRHKSGETVHFEDAEIVEHLKRAAVQHLAPYKRPKHWVFVEKLPRNAMGKVQKNVLREAYKNVF